MEQPVAAQPETIAGRYQLQRKLARGGMGEVFAATDTSTGAAIALKRMLPEAERQRSQVFLFMREYHALSELHHPRIIKVFRIFSVVVRTPRWQRADSAAQPRGDAHHRRRDQIQTARARDARAGKRSSTFSSRLTTY
jgi:hypothetical protein